MWTVLKLNRQKMYFAERSEIRSLRTSFLFKKQSLHWQQFFEFETFIGGRGLATYAVWKTRSNEEFFPA